VPSFELRSSKIWDIINDGTGATSWMAHLVNGKATHYTVKPIQATSNDVGGIQNYADFVLWISPATNAAVCLCA
jgi:hypothetical protein